MCHECDSSCLRSFGISQFKLIRRGNLFVRHRKVSSHFSHSLAKQTGECHFNTRRQRSWGSWFDFHPFHPKLSTEFLKENDGLCFRIPHGKVGVLVIVFEAFDESDLLAHHDTGTQIAAAAAAGSGQLQLTKFLRVPTWCVDMLLQICVVNTVFDGVFLEVSFHKSSLELKLFSLLLGKKLALGWVVDKFLHYLP